MATLCGGITAGFIIDCNNPTVAGIDDLIILFNRDDVSLTFDQQNPLLVTGITVAQGKALYAFYGVNNSFASMAKQVMTQNGPRYEHELDFNIAGNSTAIKENLKAMGYGRIGAIVFNNYKAGDSAIELLGAVHGLILNEGERNTGDEAMDGAYKLKLSRPQKLREPNWPAAVLIAGQAGPATYDSTKAAIMALVD